MPRTLSLFLVLATALSFTTGARATCGLGPDLENPYGQDPFVVHEHDGVLYEGGWYHLRRLVGGNWSDFGGGLAGGTVVVNAMTEYRGDLIVAGEFPLAGGQVVGNVCRWDGTSFSPLGSGVNGEVECLEVWNDRLVVGGAFTTAGGQAASRVAVWDGSTWKALGGGLTGAPAGYTTAVNDLCVHAGEVVAAGHFRFADGGTVVNGLARWDGAAWQSFGQGLESGDLPDGAGIGIELASVAGDLWVSGWFASVAGAPVAMLAVFDGATWSGTGPGFVRFVRDIEVYGDRVYACGPQSFRVAGAEFSLASWNGTAWEGAVEPNANWVEDLAPSADGVRLYFCGTFNACNGVFTGNVAQWVCDVTTAAPAADATVARLSAPFPNPFNPATTLRFELGARGPVELVIHDVRGRLVTTLVSGQREAGVHEVAWQGTDDAGRAQPSGVYLATLQAGGRVDQQRLVLLE